MYFYSKTIGPKIMQKMASQNTIFSSNLMIKQAWTIRRIVCMEVGYRMSDSWSDYPIIKSSDYPLPIRALFETL